MLTTGPFLAAEESGGHETLNPLLPATPDLVWGSIVFVLLLVFFAWIALPKINKALDARSQAIQGGIEKAEAAQAEAAAALEERTAQLAAARQEAAEIREQARKDGAAILAELKEQAQAEANRITQAAQAQIEAERLAALASLKSEVGSLAIDLASGVVGESLTEDQRAAAVVDRFLADLEASQAEAGK